jgi:hypothetical protein
MKPIYKTLFCIFLIMASAGYSLAYDKDSAIIWFEKNKNQINDFKNSILEHPGIKSIIPGISMEFIKQYGELNERDISFYKDAVSLAGKYEIKEILISRESRLKEGKPLSVRFTIYSFGIIGHGNSTSVEYFFDDDFLNLAKKYEEVFPLDEKNWYITMRSEK